MNQSQLQISYPIHTSINISLIFILVIIQK